ncbi:MAG: hypothetical protein CME71_09025 [Halobacteriovorax sp.]|nr:hypothetical protein [Halobacteriovorax sp.]
MKTIIIMTSILLSMNVFAKKYQCHEKDLMGATSPDMLHEITIKGSKVTLKYVDAIGRENSGTKCQVKNDDQAGIVVECADAQLNSSTFIQINGDDSKIAFSISSAFGGSLADPDAEDAICVDCQANKELCVDSL